MDLQMFFAQICLQIRKGDITMSESQVSANSPSKSHRHKESTQVQKETWVTPILESFEVATTTFGIPRPFEEGPTGSTSS